MTDKLHLTLPGLNLALAWLNTSLASSDDEGRPILYRTTFVEVHKTGVQLVATDSMLLLGGFAPTAAGELTPPPGIDEKPLATYIVQDTDRRAKALMTFVLAEAKAAEKDERPFDVSLEVDTVEDPVTPTLDPTLARSVFVISTDRERLTLPIYEADPPNWRRVAAERGDTESTDHTLITTTLLAALGKIKAAPGALRLDFDGPAGTVQVSCPGHEAYVFGALTPSKGIDE